MHGRADGFRRVRGNLGEVAAERMRKRDVRDDPSAEKRADAALRAIEELIRNEDVERLVFVLQAADGARRQDSLDAKHLEAVDVRPEIELGRQNPVPDAVARQERDALTSKRAEQIRAGR